MQQGSEISMTSSNDRLDRLEAIIESNSCAIQALADRMAEIALVQEEAADERRELRSATLRLDRLAEGIVNLLSSRASTRFLAESRNEI